jgi:hypothetical protein
VQERVGAGATLLDMSVPGWAEKIDVKTLSLNNCNRCVLGQIFSTYENGMHRLQIDGTNWKSSAISAAAYGFHHENLETDDPTWSESVDAEFAALRTAWLDEIAARLETADETDLTPVATYDSPL